MIAVLLPAYSEENSLSQLMPKIKNSLEKMEEEYMVIVCNDGSYDRTQEVLEQFAKEMPIKIIPHKINRGLGETSRDLFECAAENCSDDDVIVRMDCDDTHEPEFIPELVRKLRSGYDVVIASRFEKGGGQVGVNAYRAFISRAANYFMKIFFPIPGLKEYSCGFRAYRAGKIKEAIDFYGNQFIQLKGLGFTCTLEKIVKLKIIDARFAEVPFVLRYDQKRSSSKMVTSLTTYGYMTLALFYHWPWNGWRRAYRQKYRVYKDE